MGSLTPRARIARAALTLLAAGMLAALAPAGAGAFQKAVWGPVTYRGVNQFPLYHRLGARIYETTLNWNAVAIKKPMHPTSPADPAYRWPAALKSAIAQANAHGMRVLLQVSNAPAWANGGHSGFGWAPKHALDYARFIRAAAREYPGVHLWMIWNEPNRAGRFRPETGASVKQTALDAAQRRAPHLYALMLDDAYRTLKQQSPRNLVIGGDTYTAGLLDPQQWLANLKLPNGRAPRMSFYGHDPFSSTLPTFGRTPSRPSAFGEVQFADLPRLEAWTKLYLGHPVPLFLSAFCVPTAPDHTFNFYVSPPSVAARWVRDALRSARRAGYVYALGWSQVQDDLPTNSCGLISENGKHKPDFNAFADN